MPRGPTTMYRLANESLKRVAKKFLPITQSLFQANEPPVAFYRIPHPPCPLTIYSRPMCQCAIHKRDSSLGVNISLRLDVYETPLCNQYKNNQMTIEEPTVFERKDNCFHCTTMTKHTVISSSLLQSCKQTN